MISTKILFLVILGAALVLANPIPEADNNEVSVSDAVEKKDENVVAENDDELNIDDITSSTVAPSNGKSDISWVKKNIQKFKQAKDEGKKSLKKLKAFFRNMKDRGQKLGVEFKTMYKQIKALGKESVEEFSNIFGDLKKDKSAKAE